MTTFRCDILPSKRPSRRWLRVMLVVLACFCAAAAALFARARSFDGGSPPAIALLAGLPVTLPDGRPARLGNMIRPDVPTVINLWATWCGPCRGEAPYLAELRRRFPSEALNLVSLNVRDAGSSSEDKRAFLASTGLPSADYAVLGDEHIRQLTGAEDDLVPRTLVFDRTGVPLGRITGFKPLALRRIADLVE